MKKVALVAVALFMVMLCAIGVIAEEGAVAVIDGTQVFLAEADGDPCQIESGGESLRTVVKPGSTLYFSIANAFRAEDLEGLRVVVDWSKDSANRVSPDDGQNGEDVARTSVCGGAGYSG